MALTRLPGFTVDSTSSFTFANASVTANVTAGNVKTDNLLYANGTPWELGGTYANSNVAAYLPTYTGQMANALVAGTVYTNAQPNITSVGTLTSVTVSGLITATAGGIKVGNIQDTTGTNTIQLTNSDILVTGNITAGSGGAGNVTATYFIGNGSQLTGLPASYSNSNVAAYLPTYTGNFTAGNANITGTLTAGSFETSGASGNISGANYIIANFFSGDGSLLDNITASNIEGQVSNSLVASTVYTNAQPNITSVGTLTDLSVSGNATIAGNLTVSGNLNYINVDTLVIEDPIIEQGSGANGAALSTNDGKDRGSLLHYYTTTPVDAFMGWDNSNGEFAFGSNVSVSSEVITFNSLGNIRASYFLGNGSQLTGQVSNALVSGTVYTNAQPNITSVGTLSSLEVTGNVTAGNIVTNGSGGNISGANNITANFFIGNGSLLTGLPASYANSNVATYLPTYSGLIGGTLSTGAQPNITSVGTLTSLTVSGLVTATAGGIKVGNIQDTTGTNTIQVSSGTTGIIGNLEVGTGGAGNVTATYFIGNGSQLTGLPESYSNANVAAYLPAYTGNFTAGNANISGTLTAGAFTTVGSSGNVSGANYVIANFFSGDGSLLDNIAAGNIDGQVSNSLVAGTVYTNAQPNITSVGTLSGLSVTANVSAGNILTDNLLYANGSPWSLGGAYANSNVATYLPTYTGNLSPSNLVVSTSANLGEVGNVIITGGSSGQVLSTDGSGTLSWADQSGGGSASPASPIAKVDVFTADGTGNTYTLSTTPANEDQISVNIDGVMQLHSSFSLSGNVVTISGTPVTGAKVEITNIASNIGATTGKAIAMAIVFGF